MDERLFGPGEGVGDRVFEKCVGLMEKIMTEAAACFPNEVRISLILCNTLLIVWQSIKVTLFTPERNGQKMNVWVELADWQGDSDERPIEQLTVDVTSYFGDEPVSGHQAVSKSTDNLPCKSPCLFAHTIL